MKKLIVSTFILLTLNSCTLDKRYCYKLGENRIVAYKMETECADIFCKQQRYLFKDSKENVFFSIVSNEQPVCVPCDSTFISKDLPTGEAEKATKTNVNIQIGDHNKGK